MLAVDTELHLRMKVAGSTVDINGIAQWAAAVKHELACELIASVLERAQEQHLERVLAGEEEVVCTGCGVIHTGPGTVLRRGWRRRKLQTSSGKVRFRLRQVTCTACGRTRSPYPELLGLGPRQRILEELERRLLDWVTHLSYEKTVQLGARCLGGTCSARHLRRAVGRHGTRIAFTAAEPVDVLVADGSMVMAGEKPRGEEFSLALQVRGREQRGGRIEARKRVVGFGIGPGLWAQALGGVPEPQLIVTDRERGLRQLIGRYFPGARHQQCEWHLARTLGYTLSLQGMKVGERKRLVGTVIGTLRQGPEAARHGYRTLQERVRGYPRATTFLRNSAPYVLYETDSAERTTGLAEREMREMNRRTDVGARWSLEGVANLLRLRLAQRHNPDDYERLWQPYGSPAATWCLTHHVN